MASKLENFRKALNKKDISTTLSEPDVWLSWGNYSINYICTGSFYRGIPNRRMCMLYGASGTGKSLLMGHAAKEAQEAGYTVIYIDTEESIDPKYLLRIGVDIDDIESFTPIRLSTIEETAGVVSDILNTFEHDEKLCIIIDSLGMLETEDHQEEFEKKGTMKNDMGIFAKKLKKLLKNMNAKVGDRDWFILCNQHAYANQDITNGKGTHIPSGGEAQIYIPSISLHLKKLKLKEGTKVTGIRLTAQTEKTRFNQLGLQCRIEIPYATGIDPYEGVIEILEENAELVGLKKAGAWYSYEDDNGETQKFQRKNAKEHLDVLMARMEPDTIKECDEDDEE